MHLRSFTALVALSLVSSAAAQSTGALTGRVLNSTNKDYVSAAEVRVQGTNLVATTESDGSYRLPAIPAGLAVVTVTYTGSATERASIQIEPGRTATLDFELKS